MVDLQVIMKVTDYSMKKCSSQTYPEHFMKVNLQGRLLKFGYEIH